MKIGNFDLRELVPKVLHDTYGDKSIRFLDKDAIGFLLYSRKRFGKAHYVNNWPWGGSAHERGFRMPNAMVGGWLSSHKFGRAFDWNVNGMTADEVRADIMANQEDWMEAGLTTIEDGAFATTWIHGDSRYTRMDKILIVQP